MAFSGVMAGISGETASGCRTAATACCARGAETGDTGAATGEAGLVSAMGAGAGCAAFGVPLLALISFAVISAARAPFTA